MKKHSINELLTADVTALIDTTITVKGWVRSKRGNKNVSFLALNDGSTINNMQCVFDMETTTEDALKLATTGAGVAVTGKLVRSQGQGQSVEVQATAIEIYGTADVDTYPLQKKGHTLEFLREIAHLRPRTNTFGAIMRIRGVMTYAIHHYFTSKGFYNVHAPIITGSDAEGAGEMFRVTTLDVNNVPKTKEGEVDYSQDFFEKSTHLTVSGQLEAELVAMALSKVYTFGPTFRAENSNTPRHLAEFWMIEPEVAFADLTDNMDLAEDMLRSLTQYALDNCADDLKFLSEMYDKELLTRLANVATQPFERVTYTQAIEVLLTCGAKFEYLPKWGADLQKEHENYLVVHFKKPVIVTDYPRDIKAFYMKQNDDGKTVRAMDILFPYVGEIIGGSQREENYDKLQARMKEMNIHEQDLWWYMETRKYGSVPHSGFGLGFERLLLFLTGMTNVRDIIPFPRTPRNAEF
jgi:asparaginyl-tRNA synthetase